MVWGAAVQSRMAALAGRSEAGEQKTKTTETECRRGAGPQDCRKNGPVNAIAGDCCTKQHSPTEGASRGAKTLSNRPKSDEKGRQPSSSCVFQGSSAAALQTTRNDVCVRSAVGIDEDAKGRKGRPAIVPFQVRAAKWDTPMGHR